MLILVGTARCAVTARKPGGIPQFGQQHGIVALRESASIKKPCIIGYV
jgi:hypothetical protein